MLTANRQTEMFDFPGNQISSSKGQWKKEGEGKKIEVRDTVERIEKFSSLSNNGYESVFIDCYE